MNGFIYDYPTEIRAALERAVDLETGEIIDEKALSELDSLEMRRDDKCASVALWVKDLELQADQVKSLADAYNAKASQLKERARKVREWIEHQLDGAKVKRPDVSIYYGKSVSADILDEGLIPDEFFKVQRSVKKTDVLKALKAGELVNGAQLKETTYMVIKTISPGGGK